MTETGDLKPSLLVDIKKNRIRIHKNTLHALGNPCFVVLIVNPDEHTLGKNAAPRTINCHTASGKAP